MRILSLDGGGIRGIISVMILRYIEQRLNQMTGKQYLHEYFDMMAGTSTGGLIVLGCTAPISKQFRNTPSSRAPKLLLQDLLQLYVEKGNMIFPRSTQTWGLPTWLWRPRYSTRYLEGLFYELFGEATIDEVLAPTLITAYDVALDAPKLFLLGIGQHQRYSHCYIRDLARATTAAPTYFRAVEVKIEKDTKSILIDGGIFANNPAIHAYSEAMRVFPDQEQVHMVSIGTGNAGLNFRGDKAKNWGALQWLNPQKGIPLMQCMMQGQSAAVNESLNRLPNIKMYRIEPRIPKNLLRLDGTHPKNIAALQRAAEAYILKSHDRIEAICRSLVIDMNKKTPRH